MSDGDLDAIREVAREVSSETVDEGLESDGPDASALTVGDLRGLGLTRRQALLAGAYVASGATLGTALSLGVSEPAAAATAGGEIHVDDVHVEQLERDVDDIRVGELSIDGDRITLDSSAPASATNVRIDADTFEIHDGAAWQDAQAERFDGQAWQDAQAERFDGQAWRQLYPPSAIPDSAIAHYDALADSQPTGGITSIPDQAGSIDLSGEASLVSNGINGNPSYDLDGSNDSMSAAFSTIPQPITLFFVVQKESAPDQTETLFSSEDAPTQTDDFRLTFAGGGEELSPAAPDNVSGGTTTTNPTLITIVYDGANSIIRQDGTQVASGDVGSNGLNGILLGDIARTDDYYTGLVGEVLPINEAADASTISDEEQRLADKWGISI